MGKIENEHKKYKKARHQGQDCRGTLFGKGAIHFRTLYQFLASPPFLVLVLVLVAPPEKLACPLPPSLPLFLSIAPPHPLRSILSSLVSSLKTVNSARHQGECELARLSYPRR